MPTVESAPMPLGRITAWSAWLGPDPARHDDCIYRLVGQLVNDPAIHPQMAFESGDMRFLHNQRILHSRKDFENWPQPVRHRHLLRLWMAPESGRPLPAVFAPRHGAVSAGDRGGIIVPGARLSVSLAAG